MVICQPFIAGYLCFMDKRYTIAITNNSIAGKGMISILIIDTKAVCGKSEVMTMTVPISQKQSSLLPYLDKFGNDIHIIDASI